MTDYYPLLAGAIASRAARTYEERQAIYDRTREALLAQLRDKMSREDTEREQSSLEEAIKRAEIEYSALEHVENSKIEVSSLEEPAQISSEEAVTTTDLPHQTSISDNASSTPSSTPIRLQGRVQSFNEERKSGWIKLLNGPYEGIDEYFFRIADFPDDFAPARGELVEFSPVKPPKGPVRAATILRVQKRFRGKVKRWVENKGFGFISSNDVDGDVFVHYTSINEEGPRALEDGEEIEFNLETTEKGNVATGIKLFQSRFVFERFANIDEFRGGVLLEELKSLAQPEDWTYKQSRSRYRYPILFNYIVYTFAQLLSEGKIATANTPDGKSIACGNTGLVTPQQEEIFALFVANRDRASAQKWVLDEFVKSSNRKLIYIKEQPDIANYFDDPKALIYDPSIELRADVEHILEDNLDRFPANLQSNVYHLRQALDGTIQAAIKRVRRNYKTAVPQFYQQKLQLLLPLCLSDPSRAELALVVSKEGEVYIASTVLELDMAYNNARLIARPDREWL